MQEHKSLLEFVKSTNHSELVLATLVQTKGSSYKKAGAKKVIDPDGQSDGLISGGCLEGEMVEKALNLTTDLETHSFDTTSEEDRLFGYGLGCQGVLTIEFRKMNKKDLLTELESWSVDDQLWVHVVGDGPDIAPLNNLIQQMGWHLTHYTSKKNLYEKGLKIKNPERSAVLLMSHSYETDLFSLGELAKSPTTYIGILGPEKRKQQMIEDLPKIHHIEFPRQSLSNIRGPMGLDGFGRGEYAIALSVVAELQQEFFGDGK